MAKDNIPASVAARAKPNFFDVITILCVIALGVAIASATRHVLQPLNIPSAQAINLDPSYLPGYAIRTTLRMFAALFASLVFTFTYAVVAAKSRRAEMILVPILDILQSVPILGFLTFTVVFFMGLFPGQIIGVELAAIFTIFTSQAWNMAFSMYQSLKTIPEDMSEAAKCFGLTSWQRFWKLEVPAAMPGLIWNMMMSMSGGWFMIVYSETISVGNTEITLPGIGSYVGTAIVHKDLAAIFYAIGAMLFVILAYDQLLFRPLVAWSAKFRFETTNSDTDTTPWLLRLMHRTSFIRWISDYIEGFAHRIAILPIGKRPFRQSYLSKNIISSKTIDIIYVTILCLLGIAAAYFIYQSVYGHISFEEVLHVIGLGFITLIRVVVMIIIATIIWVPAGIWLGLRPQWAKRTQVAAQFMAAFPANLFFPFFVVGIVHFGLNKEIWLTPLMILGTQWYILFNVVGGASTFPGDLREASKSFHIKGWLWWSKVMLPAIFPYYITGALTACGGAWNASIAAEVASWGNDTLKATGLGAYIAEATDAGDVFQVGLGMVVMSTFVILFNRLVWHPLYDYARRRLSFS
ncbi:ABC transporter permease subunit [Commensalibacter papalotli (ex Botero et al. 2024)]|uniref:Duplicated permease component n=1 Tax=Commensalibacter papalotli (ex Botero et al. 2024) TaxID=2972766 RepID=A0ABN8W4P8_9PROT|nr:ABC transporter permease subunit [Commensalibacter papalotli (ex Botero et al. 2024)]CAI3923510.1 ABC-type anion transport system [Commensalibacter papalotli (ex Botero et al. 2024)]CAI3928610.1 ABC-type anion transport system [Commensalibacter papalotli (ex Botero et al. 2024)]